MYKILYLSHTSEIAGAEMSLIYLLKGLDKKKFVPIVVLPNDGPLVKRLKDMDVKIYTMRFPTLKKKNFFSILPFCAAVCRLARIVCQEKIDLIHCNLYLTNQHASLVSIFTGTPLICHIRNIISKTCYYYDFIFLTRTLIANSKATEKSYRTYVRKNQKSHILYNAVPLDDYRLISGTDSFRQKYGISKDAFLIGCAGQIVKYKGFHFIIEAISMLLERYPGICLFIAGDTAMIGQSQYFMQLKVMCDKVNLKNAVIFGGFIRDMIPLYSSIDVFVHSPTMEPFGRVLIEAMAMKKPVIASSVGGIPEVVEDEVTGILVPPEKPLAISCALERLIENRRLGMEMGEKGYEKVKRVFSNDVHVGAIEDIYNQTIV